MTLAARIARLERQHGQAEEPGAWTPEDWWAGIECAWAEKEGREPEAGARERVNAAWARHKPEWALALLRDLEGEQA